MSELYQLALSLMLIGMTTVFIILTLVVAGGRLLVTISNRFSGPDQTKLDSGDKDEDIPVAIIAAVVKNITKGKGSVADIKRLK